MESYTFEISEREYDGKYTDIGTASKVGEYLLHEKYVQHILKPSQEAINFMKEWIGDNPDRIKRTKPVWSNSQYVAKIYYNKSAWLNEINVTLTLKRHEVLCPNIVAKLETKHHEYILITEYIGSDIDDEQLFTQYEEQYDRIVEKIRSLGYRPDTNLANYLVKDGQIYVIDFDRVIGGL